MRLFCHLHDDAIQGNPFDSAVFENPCCQIGRGHFVYFTRLEAKGGCQLLPVTEIVLEHVVCRARAELLLHVWHWHIQKRFTSLMFTVQRSCQGYKSCLLHH